MSLVFISISLHLTHVPAALVTGIQIAIAVLGGLGSESNRLEDYVKCFEESLEDILKKAGVESINGTSIELLDDSTYPVRTS